MGPGFESLIVHQQNSGFSTKNRCFCFIFDVDKRLSPNCPHSTILFTVSRKGAFFLSITPTATHLTNPEPQAVRCSRGVFVGRYGDLWKIEPARLTPRPSLTFFALCFWAWFCLVSGRTTLRSLTPSVSASVRVIFPQRLHAQRMDNM